jgi:biotin-dependent carboxylase-like uncharacterized protein
MINILSASPFATVQDAGRKDYFDQGVSISGAMDELALRVGNILVGNPQETACIETAMAPLRLRFKVNMLFAITGAEASVKLDGITLPTYCCTQAKQGQILEIGVSKTGMWTYFCPAGGIDCKEVLGSRSTDTKLKIGGPFEGQAISSSLNLSTGNCDKKQYTTIGTLGGIGVAPPAHHYDKEGSKIIRVITAREYKKFLPESQDLFWSTTWRVLRESNRMGYRLSGPNLTTSEKLSLPSYGLVPGVIQVPPSGQPIVQLAEANTCGGYPKIGVVIGTDLRSLVQSRLGDPIRMMRVDRDIALEARRNAHIYLDTVTSAIRAAYT